MTTPRRSPPRWREDRLPRAAQGRGRGRRQGHAARRVDERSSLVAGAGARRGGLRVRRRRRVFLEKFVERPRHIEVPDARRRPRQRCIHLGERECSIQRRHQKLIEESPSPVVDERRVPRIGAISASRPCRPRATSTPAPSSSCAARTGSFYFMEVNARLQVEHPVTEMVTGIDLVQADDPGGRRGATCRSTHRPGDQPDAAMPSSAASSPRTRHAQLRMPSPGTIRGLSELRTVPGSATTGPRPVWPGPSTSCASTASRRR